MSKSIKMSMQEQESSCLSGVVDPGLRLFGKMIAPAAGPINKADHVPLHLQDEGSKAQTAVSPDEAVMSETKTPGAVKPPRQGVPCPRCHSEETKFCYFNNYNVNQPRHFCKGCHRYWTAGGNLRNVPVGAGRRKDKSTQHSKLSSSAPETSTVRIDSSDAAQPSLPCSGIAHPEPLHDPPPCSLKARSQEVVPSSRIAHLGVSHGEAPSGITHGAPFHAGEDTLPLSAITYAEPFHAKQDPSPMGTAHPVQFYTKQEEMLPPSGIAHSTPFHARQEETLPPSGIMHGMPFHTGQDPPFPSAGIANSDAESQGHNPVLDMPSANPQAQLCLHNLEWGSSNGCYFPLPVPFGGVPWPFMANFGFPGAPSMPPPPPLWNPYGWAAPWPMPYPATMPYAVPPHTVKRPRPSPPAPEESADMSICAPKSLRFSDLGATTGSSILSTLGLSIKVEATSMAGFFNGFQPKADVFQPKPTSKVRNPVAFSNSLAFQESQ